MGILETKYLIRNRPNRCSVPGIHTMIKGIAQSSGLLGNIEMKSTGSGKVVCYGILAANRLLSMQGAGN